MHNSPFKLIQTTFYAVASNEDYDYYLCKRTIRLIMVVMKQVYFIC